MRNSLPASLIRRTSRTGSCNGLPRLRASLSGRWPMRSLNILPLPGHGVLVDHAQRSVLLQPRHEAAAGGVKPRPPAIIVITEVEDIGRTRLDRHRFGRSD